MVYPGLKDTVPMDGALTADFLHIVVAALADGHARLRRIFGEVPQTKEEVRSLAPPALVLGSTNEDDRVIELMTHFVNALSHEKANPARPDLIRLQFKQIKDRMSFQSQRRHNPYHGTGDAYREHAATIRKFLKPGDFWLLFPSGNESEDALLPQSVWVLMHLQGIFTLIKKRRAQLQPAP